VGPRVVTRWMRAMLLLGTFLVTLAGLQLYFATTRTDEWFAWTIDSSLTAAFLGAFYWTSVPLALLSARRRLWVEARVGLVGVQVFVWVTLAATLLHLDKFHFSSTASVARGAAWLWLLIYVVDPPLLTLAYLDQLRRPDADPPPSHLPPGWFNALLGTQAAVTLVTGALLFVAPEQMARVWPWPLTPLTARAMSAWLLGLGFVLIGARRENDLYRLRPAAISYVVLGVLQAVALVRYGDEASWSSPAMWLYLVVLGSILLAGGYGTLQSVGLLGELEGRAAP
jgi:hypothetical protein